ncbi:MAG: hypothetical protein KKC19_02265 [Nanoarchaeota archaeon]|nr:hypothetical protein [Nanoarchaeota archaeon]
MKYTPKPVRMEGIYTIKTSFFENSRVIINSLYEGENVNEENKIEIGLGMKMTLDGRILRIMSEQTEKLSKNPELNLITVTTKL